MRSRLEPEGLTEQLELSLDRLGVDHGELYIMHRDNPAVPVGEFVDGLNRHRQAGRILARTGRGCKPRAPGAM